MGIERDEVPSRVQGRARRVKGSALVGLGKAQKPACDFQPKGLKELKTLPRSRKMGFERDEVLSREQGRARRVKGSALAYPGRSPKTHAQFSPKAKERNQPAK